MRCTGDNVGACTGGSRICLRGLSALLGLLLGSFLRCLCLFLCQAGGLLLGLLSLLHRQGGGPLIRWVGPQRHLHRGIAGGPLDGQLQAMV